MKKTIERYILTLGAVGGIVTISGMFATAGVTIALFLSGPFITDEQEVKVSDWILPCANVAAAGWGAACVAAAAYKTLPKESIEVSASSFKDEEPDNRVQCAFCNYSNRDRGSLDYLLCAVHPSGPNSCHCPDFDYLRESTNSLPRPTDAIFPFRDPA